MKRITEKAAAVLVTGLLTLTGCAVAKTQVIKKAVVDDTVPTVPMSKHDIEQCGMSMLTPLLLGKPGATVCASGNWKGPSTPDGSPMALVSAAYIVGFRNGDGPKDGVYTQDMVRQIAIFVRPGDMNSYFTKVQDNTLKRLPDGHIYSPLLGGCHVVSAKNQKNVAISGSNWKGYLIEEANPPVEKKSSGCDYSTPMYRCVAMIIGNARESAVIGPGCFLRKHADNLYHGLSFDIFMKMVKTIHFVEQ